MPPAGFDPTFVGSAERSVALDRAGISVFRDIAFLAACPASAGILQIERSTLDRKIKGYGLKR